GKPHKVYQRQQTSQEIPGSRLCKQRRQKCRAGSQTYGGVVVSPAALAGRVVGAARLSSIPATTLWAAGLSAAAATLWAAGLRAAAVIRTAALLPTTTT